MKDKKIVIQIHVGDDGVLCYCARELKNFPFPSIDFISKYLIKIHGPTDTRGLRNKKENLIAAIQDKFGEVKPTIVGDVYTWESKTAQNKNGIETKCMNCENDCYGENKRRCERGNAEGYFSPTKDALEARIAELERDNASLAKLTDGKIYVGLNFHRTMVDDLREICGKLRDRVVELEARLQKYKIAALGECLASLYTYIAINGNPEICVAYMEGKQADAQKIVNMLECAENAEKQDTKPRAKRIVWEQVSQSSWQGLAGSTKHGFAVKIKLGARTSVVFGGPSWTLSVYGRDISHHYTDADAKQAAQDWLDKHVASLTEGDAK